MVYRQSVPTVSFARAINRSAIHPLRLASIAAEIRHNSIYIHRRFGIQSIYRLTSQFGCRNSCRLSVKLFAKQSISRPWKGWASQWMRGGVGQSFQPDLLVSVYYYAKHKQQHRRSAEWRPLLWTSNRIQFGRTFGPWTVLKSIHTLTQHNTPTIDTHTSSHTHTHTQLTHDTTQPPPS